MRKYWLRSKLLAEPRDQLKPSPLDLAIAAIEAEDPGEKCALARRLALEIANSGGRFPNSEAPPNLPDRPGRPKNLRLAAPGQTPRRRLSSDAGRAALLHALAHIELNAVDMAIDMAFRFRCEIGNLGLDGELFVADWCAVAGEEAHHFGLLAELLAQKGMRYGDLPAHDGLWRSAEQTAGSVTSRLVIAPLVLEARGLDVTPDLITRLRACGEIGAAAALEVIYADEVGHVATGARWFNAVCDRLRIDPEITFRREVDRHFAGRLKPPFNIHARAVAGIPLRFYAEAQTLQTDL